MQDLNNFWNITAPKILIYLFNLKQANMKFLLKLCKQQKSTGKFSQYPKHRIEMSVQHM